jgi:hypothetical protein
VSSRFQVPSRCQRRNSRPGHLLTALYVELTDRIIPVRGFTRCGPGGRPQVTDAEPARTAVAQAPLRFDDERHLLRIAPRLIGHRFPGCWPKASTTRGFGGSRR